MDLSKGLLIAGFTLQVFKTTDLLSLFEYIISGIICAYFSLQLIGDKKNEY